MHSYSSAVDGKTLIRVGNRRDSHGQSVGSTSSLHTVKSAGSLQMVSSQRPVLASTASSRRPNLGPPSPVTIISSSTSNGDRSSNFAVTVKNATPQKKMASIINTQSGIISSSFADGEAMTSSAGLTSKVPTTPPAVFASSSPKATSILMTSSFNDFGTMTSAGEFAAKSRTMSSSDKDSSIFMTSSTIPMKSDTLSSSSLRTAKPNSSILPTSYESSNDVMLNDAAGTSVINATQASSVSRKMSSVLFTSTISSKTRETNDQRNMGVAFAEIHSQPITDLPTTETVEKQEILPSGDGSVIIPSQHNSSALEKQLVEGSDASGVSDDAGSLVFDNDLRTPLEVTPSIKNIQDKTIDIAQDTRITDSSPSKASFSRSNSLSTATSDSTQKLRSTLSNDEDSLLETSNKLCAGNGSEMEAEPEAELKPASTFSFISWEIADKPDDRKCHRVLIFKDTEIVLMFTASCDTDRAGDDSRLSALMVDIAVNCAEKLKKMKNMTLPKLQAEHMDTLPLTDSRSTKEHLDEISRDLDENVTINDVAYRFQPPKEDAFIGTFVDGGGVRMKNCEIGHAGVVVILIKKNRFATVEAFSDQLCRHVLSAQPTCLGQLTDTDIRQLNQQRSSKAKKVTVELKDHHLLWQNFVADPSIIVAEAARRSFVRIEDFLLFC